MTISTDKLSPLASPSATKAVLERHGLTTKKSFGQNFLVNDEILRRIIDLAEVTEQDDVLEVGPGIGALTIPLLKCAHRVISVERDRDLPAVLAETCQPWRSSWTLIEKDALQLDEQDLSNTFTSLNVGSVPTSGDAPMPYCDAGFPQKLVSNLPYAIAATLILDYFERFDWLQSATVMVQAEVADRICAHPGTKNYGAYTLKLALHTQVQGRFFVGRNNFFPPPRVDSAVIRLDRAGFIYKGTPLTTDEIVATKLMIDAAFANRRKTLSNSCRTYFGGKGSEGASILQQLPMIFRDADIDPMRRGETLSLDEFAFLGKLLSAFRF